MFKYKFVICPQPKLTSMQPYLNINHKRINCQAQPKLVIVSDTNYIGSFCHNCNGNITQPKPQLSLGCTQKWVFTIPKKQNASLQEPQIIVFWPQLIIMWSVTTIRATITTATTTATTKTITSTATTTTTELNLKNQIYQTKCFKYKEPTQIYSIKPTK